MIVVDASVIVEILAHPGTRQRWAHNQLRRAGFSIHAPHLIDAEVLSAIRRLCLTRMLPAWRAQAALAHLRGLGMTRYPHLPFLARALELRENLTGYDALYVTLAETLGAPLLTLDEAVAGAPGHQAEVLSPAGS